MKIALLVFLCVLFGNALEQLPIATEIASTGTYDRWATRKLSITYTGTVKSIEPLGNRKL